MFLLSLSNTTSKAKEEINMKAFVEIYIRPGTLVQDGMKVFESLDKLGILDIDNTELSFIKTGLKHKLDRVKLYYLDLLFNLSNAAKYIQVIDDVLSQFSCVEHENTHFGFPPSKDEKVIDFESKRAARLINGQKNIHGEPLLIKIK